MKKRGKRKPYLHLPHHQKTFVRVAARANQYLILKSSRIYAIYKFARDEYVYKFVPLAEDDANGPLRLYADGHPTSVERPVRSK